MLLFEDTPSSPVIETRFHAFVFDASEATPVEVRFILRNVDSIIRQVNSLGVQVGNTPCTGIPCNACPLSKRRWRTRSGTPLKQGCSRFLLTLHDLPLEVETLDRKPTLDALERIRSAIQAHIQGGT